MWFLQSFVDPICSGMTDCRLKIGDIVYHGFQPCPLELSSFLQASYSCIEDIHQKDYVT